MHAGLTMIFEDTTGRRRRWASWIGASLLATVSIPVLLFGLGSALPTHRSLLLAPHGTPAPTPDSAPAEQDLPTAIEVPGAEYLELLRVRDLEADAVLDRIVDAALPLPDRSHLVFMVDHPDSFASVREHADAIHAVSPDWFRVRGDDCKVELVAGASIEFDHGDALVLPRVANLDGDVWTSAATSRLLADASARQCVVEELAAQIVQRGADGINVDFESLAPEDAAGLVIFVAELRIRLHVAGKRVTVDAAGNDRAYDLARLGRAADAVVLMAYDEHSDAGAPGPIASRQWLANQVDHALTRVAPERLVIALGAYCYDWPTTGPGLSRSVPAALSHAATLGVTPKTIAGTGNLRHDYRDQHGAAHQVWCVDATAGADALALLEQRGLHRTALWRAGTEDPSWWPVLTATDASGRAHALATIPVSQTPVSRGEGDVIVQRSGAHIGRREVVLDEQGLVLHSRLTVVPTPALVERRGAAHGDGVVLTFDDGPDPTWTPAILAALARNDAPAAFFVVGTAASDHPEIVEKIHAAGHVIASHSWDHPDMATLGHQAAKRQLERTARLLESLVDHEILFYRAPYTAIVDIGSAAAFAVHRPAFDAGYAYVGASVDPADWNTADADAITNDVLAQVEAGGRVVVLHDGGGDRHATVAAIDRLIPELRRRGHPIVGLDTYLGESRVAVAPPLSVPSAAIGAGTWVVAHGQASGLGLLQWLFAVCTILAAARILALAVLVLRPPVKPAFNQPERQPLVTVLLPAYNEGKVIEASIRSLLAGEYGNLEILVIDDGSTDDTAVVAKRMAAIDPRVRCLRKANGGKASASNLGIREARGEIIIAVDADTLVAADAIRRMTAHFANPEVDAVCGNVEVGNVCSVLTRFQAIEYVTSQNFDRRAFAALNCIGVVPGALGAWRRSAVLAVGGYSEDTLVEDADLTLCVLRRGGRISYEPRAVGRTEAPLSLRGLWKQRFRWTYGTYQCLAKHRRSLFRGTLGWIAMPNVLLFQGLFPILSPIGDVALIFALATGSWSAVLSGYLGFLAMDVIASALAFWLDRKPMRWLPLLLVQRFTYRLFLYAVSFRAMVAVLGGSRHGWRKLERTATVIALPSRILEPVATRRAA